MFLVSSDMFSLLLKTVLGSGIRSFAGPRTRRSLSSCSKPQRTTDFDERLFYILFSRACHRYSKKVMYNGVCVVSRQPLFHDELP